ncbi:hypothetical protein NC652_038072 [Populus alba x Populus x berolinensis]|nr:hypothetical protein NC652_038072 [Populus alba x Populus x berolinensis]
MPNSYFYDLRLLSFASFKPIIAPPSRCCASVDKICGSFGARVVGCSSCGYWWRGCDSGFWKGRRLGETFWWTMKC